MPKVKRNLNVKYGKGSLHPEAFENAFKMYSGTTDVTGKLTILLDAEHHNGVVLQAMVQNKSSRAWQGQPAISAISMNSNRSEVTVHADAYYANSPIFIVVGKRSFL